MNTWIFQGSPDKFDIEGYLAAGLAKITWMVTRYALNIGCYLFRKRVF
jgi:hypothetical protein